ncbi:hypothetical protein GCM10010329_63610 [Streptomyces spiroverticillatus]|uniref:DUF397 domain-containing protein n=1 Tax=Streptomyces finlayi TaxID=67296 RepID=A0A919CDD1_9ACTN|nr:DUF397 domain-containing protein [Streptomyces finlayi]GHA31548.1 hypothetical protein GCM10010329_63610 [Streptomyces spiroverticillatus]GHD11042.1 hypothetical protein GCM10010334_66940 [Streptomyces finlayi]
MKSTPTSPAGWLKSSYSAADNECVEVALGGDAAGVRDSKWGKGPELALSTAAFSDFLAGIKAGSLGGVSAR